MRPEATPCLGRRWRVASAPRSSSRSPRWTLLHHGPAWTPRPLHTVFTDPEHVVRWAWRTRHLARELVPALEVTHPQLVIIRLHSRSDVDRFVTHLSSGVA